VTKIHHHSLSAQSIEALLKVAPRSNEELRKLTGYSRSGVSSQLERMELAGIAHRERVEIDRAAGFQYMWHLGPARDCVEPAASPRQSLIPGAVPKQKTVRQYESINRRDYLVAALFGKAGESK
jgi:DNA-binding Lrp family transcriptional regulator